MEAAIYLMALYLSFQACKSIQFDAWIKKNRVKEAQLLYGMIVVGLAYLVGTFVLKFLP